MLTLHEINGANLAYIGDAVLELMVRKKLVTHGGRIGELNKIADKFVSAPYQSKAMNLIVPILTEEENDAYRLGKNVHTNSLPKHATRLEYRKATGLEALFGYLYLKGDLERLEVIFDTGFPLSESLK